MFGKAKDPVCGMKVTEKTAPATSKHMGRAHYFSSRNWKEKSDEDPLKYTPNEPHSSRLLRFW